MAKKQIHDPGWKWDDHFPISQGVQSGNMIYVSGQVAIDPSGKMVGKGDMKAQTRQTLENIRSVLAVAGATMEDVVKMTSFVTDMSKVGEALEVRGEFFALHPPASTTVEVKALIYPDLMIEIEVVAMKG